MLINPYGLTTLQTPIHKKKKKKKKKKLYKHPPRVQIYRMINQVKHAKSIIFVDDFF
jgi:hypothetical protein